MNKLTAITGVFLSFLIVISFTSCKKKINGCTDATADNYSVEANIDNGSCGYHGNLTTWYDNTTRDSLLANNIASVTVFVDNETFLNINPAFVLWSAEPECSTTTVGNWVSFQGVKSKTITLNVKAYDSSNAVVREWTESILMQNDVCELYQIVW